MGLLPHRYPFALVDRVLEHVPGEKAVAIKNVTLNEPQFQGHFPGHRCWFIAAPTVCIPTWLRSWPIDPMLSSEPI